MMNPFRLPQPTYRSLGLLAVTFYRLSPVAAGMETAGAQLQLFKLADWFKFQRHSAGKNEIELTRTGSAVLTACARLI